MLKLIKYRLEIITVLFAAFGGVLAGILGIQELQLQYVGLASLIAFVINLLVSFLLKQVWKKKVRNRLKMISLALFIGLMAAIAFHIYFFQTHTFRYTGFENKVSYHVKGNAYTPLGDSLSKAHRYMEPADILKKFMGGSQGASRLWKPETITTNTLTLLSTYGLIIIFFSFLVSILVETLALRYPKTAMA